MMLSSYQGSNIQTKDNNQTQQLTTVKIIENNTTVVHTVVDSTDFDHLASNINHDPLQVTGSIDTNDVMIDRLRNTRAYDRTIDHAEIHVDSSTDTSLDRYSNRDERYVNRGEIKARDRLNHDAKIKNDDLLDRRLNELKPARKHRLDTDDVNVGDLYVVKDTQPLDDKLGQINFKKMSNTDSGVGDGELYAYNYPSLGLGAGVGSTGVGAITGTAGVSAGVGQAMSAGRPVPALGGVGITGGYTSAGVSGDTSEGVGGLVSGAGSGAAAGLVTGRVITALGLGGPGAGDGDYNYDHLPADGALHIMLHVDGSGSILNTRKQLEVMKDTLLKERLLPYYNNDEDLYNRRVTIIDSSGERSLDFFNQAAEIDNVLAIAFQDEAQPVYHLPNFNKQPESMYLDDLVKLKNSLNNHDGVYRGILIQVDRGKTFAKSFKTFLENSFQGKGYLSNHNLKKYHRDDNHESIKNGDGVVFSDEYHASDSGDPAYYLELLINVSSRVGLSLDTVGGGLTDGVRVDQ